MGDIRIVQGSIFTTILILFFIGVLVAFCNGRTFKEQAQILLWFRIVEFDTISATIWWLRATLAAPWANIIANVAKICLSFTIAFFGCLWTSFTANLDLAVGPC